MTDQDALVTSPFVFIHPRRREACAFVVGPGQEHHRYRQLSLEAFRIIYFFMTPSTPSDAAGAGIDETDIREALASGLLVSVDCPAYENMMLWEVRRWSRAAYLLFSQMDLEYLESVTDIKALPNLTIYRRKSIESYMTVGPYPEHHLINDANSRSLPYPEEQPDVFDLDALVNRRSCRDFSTAEIHLKQFSNTLFYSTSNVRMACESQVGGDPFYLLNSFYSWLEIYVAVQGVEDTARGLFQYDPLKHQLRLIREGVEDSEIIATIQHQNWIGGGGFCVFVGVHWERYMWLYRHSRAYINLLIQVGEYGQELLQAAYQSGLVGWMTPAVTESKAATLLGLDAQALDIVYFLKFGATGA